MFLLFGWGGIGYLRSGPAANAEQAITHPAQEVSTTFLSQIGPMKDTVYTLKPSYFEVRLDSQKMYLHRRDGTFSTYLISTGTERLDKGIETRSGIFLIQNKIRMLYSLQFDSTKVFNWLGFNWGIGFHSLEGRRYYWNLGRRPSSHGCIRLREEDALELFETVELGTPVLVHKGSLARVVGFLKDSVQADTTSYSREEAESIWENRLLDLYRGNRLSRSYPDIPLDRRIIGHSGIPLGDGSKVPDRQRIPAFSDLFHSSVRATTIVREPRLRRAGTRDLASERERVEQVILP